jgi:hypothetical protein
MSKASTSRPFVFSVIEDDGVNVTIEVSEEDYQADLAAGIDEEAMMNQGGISSYAAASSHVIRN